MLQEWSLVINAVEDYSSFSPYCNHIESGGRGQYNSEFECEQSHRYVPDQSEWRQSSEQN